MMNSRLYLIIYILLLLGAATPAIAQTINGNVYGGGNLAQVEGSTTINVIDGTVSDQNVDDGNVYGGGYGASAILTGNTTINVSGGTVTKDVYGGGALANVTGSTEVNIQGGTITQDVYGGGALANVSANTSVNLTGGTIRNSYGGGLGSNEVAALVEGDATTTLNGSKVTGSIFGANNVNGTPQGHVKVHVLATTDREGQTDGQYDVAAVYGGGNKAAYIPSEATFSANKGFTEVLIENCDNSIAYVYGGGNAAPVPATDVKIYGANAIDNAFAGGNGAGQSTDPSGDNYNPGADIGYTEYTRDEEHKYGAGTASITVYGGTVHNVFGGSNTLGYIADDAQVNIETQPDDYEGTTCDLAIINLFGGGNKANGKAATIAIDCTGNGKIENVFGGANQADVEGDITLNITGGNIGNIFGGNNQSGVINGAIAVNINWGSDDCGIKHIDNVYGGGNLAPYTTPLGKTHPTITLTNGTVSHNVFGGGLGATAVMTGDPVVNINGGAVGGSVYGGGEQADVVGSTYVTINDGRLGADIFGGGQGLLNYDGSVKESADVSGTTHVTINGGEFAVAYDGLKFKQHYNIYGGGNIASQVGETHVYVTKGMVSNASDGSDSFLDNDRFESHEAGMAQAYYHEGQMYFCIFGGGYGKNTSVTGDTWVDFNISGMTDINSTAIEDDLLEYQSYLDVIGGGFNGTVGGDTNVHVGGNAMCRNVYGGGLYATIGNKGRGETGKTNVHITGGNIDNVYGGGVMGDIMTSTNVNIGLTANMTFDGHDHAMANDKITILMSVYGGNDVSGHVPTANITHNGGEIDQNIYGAGNGDYRGYYTPGVCDYAEGENDNYFPVDHSGDTSKDGKSTKGPKGNTYKGRPQTDNVSITMGGNSHSDRAVVLGQVFGGGNSCTVGHWKTDLSSKYGGDPHQWRNDPDFFEGGGHLNITLNSHVKIGYDNTTLASASDDIKDMYTRDGENVSGLFMGCSGNVLATQSTAEDDYDYHHYYDSYTAKYWPGFAVFDNSGNPLSREEGLKSFKAYLNNIMVWSNDVTLSIDNAAEDIWLANFVGGGFRGSMKRKDGNAYQWTLPAGVKVGNCIVGGAYNTDVVYRVFDTENDMHTYKTQDGHYLYRTVLKPEWNEGEDYHHLEKDAGGNTTAIVRFYFDGGILSSDGSTTRDITKLTLANVMDASDTSKRRIFAGCFTSGTTEGNTVIDYTGTGSPRVHGGGAYAHVAGDATVNIKGGVAGDVYGGGALANVTGNTTVDLIGGTVVNAYGGGLGDATTSALVAGNATVTLNGATADNIFGCNNINGAPQGTVTVTTTSGTVNHNVYGGGNQAAASVSPIVNIKGGTITENVYGGGYGATAVITGSPIVTVTGGTVTQDVYGGGSLANTEGSTTITVSGGAVTQDVYGGGALANVTGNTTVDLIGGSIGSAYGGGLGQLAADAVGTEGDPGYVPAIAAVAALVEGNATVTLGNAGGTAASKVTGSIFGANNVNGTPKGHVKVHVRHTVPHDEQSEPRNTHDVKNSFDVLAVYGGGNKAAYEPTINDNDDDDDNDTEDAFAEVLIENCENSIAYVYGGGNAAPVPATEVKIHGANAIDYAFAGGNGQTEGQGAGDNPGADVGYLGYYSTGGATEYGAGTSHIWIYGGTVNNVFGGSNTLGYIRTHAYVDIPEFDGGACLLEVGNVHAGGNKAEMFCGGSMTLACSEGVNTIFAGSNSADIYGDIELNINSGTYSNIFGGNNTSGNVHGSITINIDETGCWPVMIGNLYGCGNKAAYSIYGYNTDQDKTPRTKEQYDALTEQQKEDIKNAHGIAIPYNDPVINVVSCTRIDHIFGGGKGVSAAVYGNPTVNINTIKGKFAGRALTPAFVLNDDSQREDNTAEITIPDEPGTIGSIYGGGDAAPVVGNTRVNIGTEATAKHISGSDEMKKEAQPVAVTILGNVFGGSKGVSDNPAAGRVTGTTKVLIGE